MRRETTFTSQSYFFGTQSDFQSGVDKQNKSANFRFHGSKSGLVYMLKVVHSLAFDVVSQKSSHFSYEITLSDEIEILVTKGNFGINVNFLWARIDL